MQVYNDKKEDIYAKFQWQYIHITELHPVFVTFS